MTALLKNNRIFLIIFFAQLSLSVWGQNASIKGKVFDINHKPIPFLSIGLCKSKDSTILKGSLSDSLGNYEFKRIDKGLYLLSVSGINYQQLYIKTIEVTDSLQEINVGEITVLEAVKQLNEVVVTGKKPFIERKIDRLIANIDGSILAQGNNGLEVLKGIPTLKISPKDEISVMGKAGTLILIDGKPQYSLGIDVLKEMRGNQIEKVEVYSNPPAKFDAAGSSVINIITKRDKMLSTFSQEINFPFYPNSSISGIKYYSNYSTLTLFNQFGKVKTKSIISYRHGQENFQQGTDFTLFKATNQQRLGTWQQESNTNLLRYSISVDYDLDKSNILNFDFSNRKVVGDYYYSHESTYKFISANNTLDSTLNLKDKQNSNERPFPSLYAGFTHKFKGEGKQVTLSFQRLSNSYEQSYDYDNIYSYKDKQRVENIQTTPNSTQTIQAYKIAFEIPTVNKFMWEFGSKLTSVDYLNNFRLFVKAPDNSYTEKASFRNDYIYSESIFATYVSLQKNFEKWGLNLGLRNEHTSSKGENEGKIVEASYNNLFPSALFQYTISDTKQLGFSYSLRVQRPTYSEFNPKAIYQDPLFFNQGNSNLKPQYIHALELNYSWNDLYAAISFSRTDKRRVSIPSLVNGSIITNQIFNLEFSDVATFALSKPLSITSWWQVQNSFNGYYNQSKLLNQKIISNAYWDVSSQHTINLSKTAILEASLTYSSPQVDQYMEVSDIKSISLGYKNSFLKKRLDISINFSDIFGINKFTFITNTETLRNEAPVITNARNISVTAVFKFPTTTKFRKKFNNTVDFGEIR